MDVLGTYEVFKVLNKFDSNCEPWSVVMVLGAPKREIQCVQKADATHSAVISFMAICSGQRETLSITVRQYRYSCTAGSTMMSRWTR
jgi:hypothetical protein